MGVYCRSRVYLFSIQLSNSFFESRGRIKILQRADLKITSSVLKSFFESFDYQLVGNGKVSLFLLARTPRSRGLANLSLKRVI